MWNKGLGFTKINSIRFNLYIVDEKNTLFRLDINHPLNGRHAVIFGKFENGTTFHEF
jgi:hypothetical protein